MQINNNAVSRTQSRLVRSQKDTKRYIKIFFRAGGSYDEANECQLGANVSTISAHSNEKIDSLRTN